MVVAEQDQDRDEFCPDPAHLRKSLPLPDQQGGTEKHSDYHRRPHDDPVQLVFHHMELGARRRICGLAVIDEQPRQIEQAGKPGHHEHNMYGLQEEIGAQNSVGL